MTTFAADCWFLTGATAGGKSAIGVELAGRLGAEIVSLDSMAVYRGMDIGTAKPTQQQRQAVPHHLIDLVDPWEEFNLSRYLKAARAAVDDIRRRSREVVFVGGTPLYLKALLRGVFDGPSADHELRARLAHAEQAQPGSLHQRLQSADPLAAARLHPNDIKRIIRALEVFERTGRPISELQRQFNAGRPAADCRVFVVDWPRDELNARIHRRVDAMFAGGLVAETRHLLADGRPLSRSAGQAVGYCEVIDHLEGRRALAETMELVKQNTRQLAKRQCTWFRSLSECRFIGMSEPVDPSAVACRIADQGRIITPN